jgi:hypothetical protein
MTRRWDEFVPDSGGLSPYPPLHMALAYLAADF